MPEGSRRFGTNFPAVEFSQQLKAEQGSSEETAEKNSAEVFIPVQAFDNLSVGFQD